MGRQAKEFTKRLLPKGEKVYLEFDVPRDEIEKAVLESGKPIEVLEVRYGMLMMVLCDREGKVYDVWITFGYMLGQGLSEEEALKRLNQTVEGVHTVKAVYELSESLNIHAPISLAVYKIVVEGFQLVRWLLSF